MNKFQEKLKFYPLKSATPIFQMAAFLRTLKTTNAIISASKCQINSNEAIAISYGKKVEFVDLEFKVLKTIYSNNYIKEIVQIFNPKDSCLLLLTVDNEYIILKNGEEIELGLVFQRRVTGITPLKTLRTKDLVIIWMSSSRIILGVHEGSKLIFYDNLNFVGPFTIIDMITYRDDVVLLLRDYENKLIYSVYGINSNKRGVHNKKLGNLPNETKKIIFYKEKVLAFRPGHIAIVVDNKPVYETNFANPDICSWVETETGILLNMKNGELIKLIVTDSIRIEKIFFLESCFETFLSFENDVYFGGSLKSGKILFEIVDNNLKIIKWTNNDGIPSDLKINEGLTFNYPYGSSLYSLKHEIIPNVLRKIPFDSPIKKFWVFKKILIISFPSYSMIYDTKTSTILMKCDQIRNCSVQNYKVIFNTSTSLYKSSDGIKFTQIEIGTVLISDFYLDKFLAYTGKELLLYNRNTLEHKIPCAKNITGVLLDPDFILVSDNMYSCMVFDINFELKGTFKGFNFVSYVSHASALYFLDIKGSVLRMNREILLGSYKFTLGSLKKIVSKAALRSSIFFLKEVGKIILNGLHPVVISTADHHSSYFLSTYNASSFGLMKTTEKNLIMISKDNEILVCDTPMNPQTKITETKIHQNLKFISKFEKTQRFITGEVKKTGELSSVLKYWHMNEMTAELTLDGASIVFIEAFKGGRIVIGLNLDDGSSLRSYKCNNGFKLVSKLVSPVKITTHAVGNNRIAIGEYSKVLYYALRINGKLEKLLENNDMICPLNINISSKRSYLHVNDLAHPYCILSCSGNLKSMEEEARIDTRTETTFAADHKNKHIIADSKGYIFLYRLVKESFLYVGQIYYGDILIEGIYGKIGPKRNKRTYFVTEAGGIGVLSLNSSFTNDELSTLIKVQKFLCTSRLFTPTCVSGFIDYDLFEDIDIETTSKELGLNKCTLRELIDKCEGIY